MSEKETESREAFAQVCALLQAGHRQGNDSSEETLNRLFRKHLTAHQKDIASNPPWLRAGNVTVVLENRSKAALRKLAPRPTSRVPRYTDFPVVIVRYRGRDCLIDGGSRLHAWHEAGDTGNHPAYILTV